MLTRRLTSADQALDRDREAAREFIAEAAALLSAGREELPATGARVMAHVDANLGDTIPVGSLAALTRLSASHFSRAFQRLVGASPQAWRRHNRPDPDQSNQSTT
jgi:transcriptional regulator GlxA family with amidase domain